MISEEVKKAIEKVAADPQVQMSVIRAMFQECERGSDLWEWLEGDGETFKPETRMLLWGRLDLREDEEDEGEEKFTLCGVGHPHEVIDYLLNTIEENVQTKVVP